VTGRWIGETSFGVGSSRFWLARATRRGDRILAEGAFLRAKSGWCCKAGGSRRHEGAMIGRCHINLPVQPIRTHFRIRRQERGMAALLDRSLNVLAAAQSNTALGEELLSFAGKFVISR
jgi:hypothetical protein